MTKNWTNKIFVAFMAAACAVTLTLGMPVAMNASAAYSHSIELAATAENEYSKYTLVGVQDSALQAEIATIANGSKYTSAYGASTGTPWCVIFAWWCANQVGVNTNIIPKNASASTISALIGGNGGTVYSRYSENHLINSYAYFNGNQDVAAFSTYQPHVGDFVWLSTLFMVITAVNGNSITVTHGNWSGTMAQHTYNWVEWTKFDTQTILGYVSPWYVGDVDKDHAVTSTDARMINEMFACSLPMPTEPFEFIRADVDSSGVIDSTDARIALQMFVGNA